jgi:hypothetical protein
MPNRAVAFVVLLQVLTLIFVPSASSQQSMPVSRTYALPCAPQTLAVATDGSTAWFACEGQSAENVSDWVHRNWVYALDLESGRVKKISEGHGFVRFLPAPHGAEAIMMRLGERKAKHAVLVNGNGIVKELPIIDAIDWNSAGTNVYFEAGSTIEAEAWNILGILNVRVGSVKKVKLSAAAEDLYVCRATGNLYFGGPSFDEKENLKFAVAEYDADGKPSGKTPQFPAGEFSSNCRFVVTEGFFHGTVPWEITEVASGKRLEFFPISTAKDAAWLSFLQWNPRRERLYIRTSESAVNGNIAETKTQLEVVDAATRSVVAEFFDFDGAAAWCADGRSVLLARGKRLDAVTIGDGQ